MKLIFIFWCCICFLANAVADSSPRYTFFTGSTKGTYYRFGEDIAKACPKLNIQVVPTDGSLENINSLISDTIVRAGYRLAFVQNDALTAILNSEPVTKKLIRPVMTMYREDIHVLVSRSSGIRSLTDLVGKRVAIGTIGSGTWFTANAIRSQLQLDWISVERDPEESILAVLVGDLDAMVAVGGSPIKIFAEMGKYAKNHVLLVNLVESQLNELYASSKLPGGTYLWQDNVVELRLTRSSLVAASSVPASAIQELLTCINTNISELRRWGHQKWSDVEPPKARKHG